MTQHRRLLTVRLVSVCAVAICWSQALLIDPPDNAATAPIFSREPPALHLVASSHEDSVTCALAPPAGAGPHLWQLSSLRWRYEEFSYPDGGRAQFVRSGYVKETAAAAAATAASSVAGPGFGPESSFDISRPPAGLRDAGNGRLVLEAGDNEADFVVAGALPLPRFKLHCEARVATQGQQVQVVRSRKMVVKKIINLRQSKSQIICQSGPLSGTAVCEVRTDPSYTDFFNVTYYRQFGSAVNSKVKLEYSPHLPKYAVFENGFNLLHIMSLTQEDAKYGYMAEISLSRRGSVVYSHTSPPMPIQVLPSSTATLPRGQVRQSRYSVHEVRPGLVVLLPCYATGRGGYSWTKDGKPLPVSNELYSQYPYSFIVAGSGNLRIRVSDRSQAGVYECTVGDDEVLETVKLDLFKPLSLTTSEPLLNVDFGSNASVRCEVQGWPLHTVYWLHNGAPVENSEDVSSRLRVTPSDEAVRRGFSEIVIRNVTLKNQGPYQCFAERLLKPEEGQIPYDSAQATTELLINKMPPHLVTQRPAQRFIPVVLSDSARSSGQFACAFTAAPAPKLSVLVDGSEATYQQLADSGAFVKRRVVSGKRAELRVNYSASSLEHTGRVLIEARNEFGSASCEFHLFVVTDTPRLSIRPFVRSHFAVSGSSFALDCHVLGGLNSRADLAAIRASFPGLRINTYSLRWQLLRRDSEHLLTLPADHRTQTNVPGRPDRLKIASVEMIDAGNYTCTAVPDFQHAGSAGAAGSSEQSANPSTSAVVSVTVVSGVRAKEVNNQLDVEKDILISDACKPVNTPTGPWYAWWEFTGSGHYRTVLEPCDYRSDCASLVKYIPGERGARTSVCPKDSRQFADAGVPHSILVSRKVSSEASLDIRPSDTEKFEGIFTCHIVSCYDSAVQSKRVTYKKEYKFKANHPPNSREVILGSSLDVNCALTETGPHMPKLVWFEGNTFRDEKRVPSYAAPGSSGSGGNSRHIHQFDNGTLHISSIRRQDRSFLCVTDVPNRQHMRSVTFNPIIRYPARVLPFPEKRLELRAGSSHAIRCSVEGDAPMNVSWVAKYEGDNNVDCRLVPPSRRYQYSQYYNVYAASKCSPEHVRSPDELLAEDAGMPYYMLEQQQQSPIASIAVTESGLLQLSNVNQGVRGRYTCRASNRYSVRLGDISEQHLDIIVIQRPGPVKTFAATDHGTESVTLQWETPERSGNKDIICYNITYLQPTGQLHFLNTSAEHKSVTVRRLQPGTRYTFNISAVNSVGPGPVRSCSVNTKERQPSGTVLELAVRSAGPSSLRISWRPPDLLKRNGRITNYTVAVRPLSAAGSVDCRSDANFKVVLECPSLTALIGPSGGGGVGGVGGCVNRRNLLKAFTEYQVRVTPSNAVGAGPPLCARVRTLESTPRSPPLNLRCEAKSDSQVLLSWQPPDPSGINGIIKDYQIQYMPADGVVMQDESKLEELTSASLKQVIGGLRVFTNYSFTVTVANGKGRSAPSRRRYCRTLQARPEPPGEIRVHGENASHAVVTWRHTPAPNGPLTGYRIRYECQVGCGAASPGGNASAAAAAAAVELFHPADGTAYYEYHVVGGLLPNAHYEFQVAAVNAKAVVGEFSRPVAHVTVEKPPLRIVPFSHEFKVQKNSRLVLDCYIVGYGSHEPRWIYHMVDSPSIRKLANGSIEIDNADLGDKYSYRYKCCTSDQVLEIVYTVHVIGIQTRPTPQTPRLMPGQRTNSSLEVIWRPRGISSPEPSAVPVPSGQSLIREFNLDYTNLYTGAGDSRTVSAQNRSYLVDPVTCGARMTFRIRAVNGFDLKSSYSDTLEMRALGSRPVLASGANLVSRVLRRSVEFNFSGILPGDGCHPLKYIVYFYQPDGRASPPVPAVAVRRDDLVSGCCLNVTETFLLTGGASLRFTVVAHNAAGNLTVNGSLKAPGQTDQEQHPYGWSASLPDSGNSVAGGTAGAGAGSWLSWPYMLAAGVLVLLLVCLFVVCSAVLYRQHKHQGGPAGNGSLVIAANQPHHLQHQQHLQQQQQRHLHHPQQLANYQQHQQLLLHQEKGVRATHLVAGKPVAAVPYEEDEEDRESVDSKGNIRAYATFDADGAGTKSVRNGGNGGQGHRRHHRRGSSGGMPPYENDSSTLAGGPYSKGGPVQPPPQPPPPQALPAGYPLSPAERLQQQQQQQPPPPQQQPPPPPQQLLGIRASHMSSVTTLSSNHDELADAYRAQQLMQHPLPAHTAEYEENSGSSGATDPGIRNFTSRPPNPNELRNATCEVPLYQQDDARSRPGPHQQPQAPRLKRQPSTAESDQTYESIDDMMQRSLTLRGPLKSRTGTLPSLPHQQQAQLQPQHRRSFKQQQQQRLPPSEVDSYGTGVYEVTDSAYNYGTQPVPRYRIAGPGAGGGGGGGGSGTYNSYRPSQRLYWPDRQQQLQQQHQVQLGPTREDGEDEVQQLLGSNRGAQDSVNATSAAAAPSRTNNNNHNAADSDDSTEEDPTYDTRNVTFV